MRKLIFSHLFLFLNDYNVFHPKSRVLKKLKVGKRLPIRQLKDTVKKTAKIKK